MTAPTHHHKATKRIQQALRKDPNDIGALLQLAAMLDPRKKPALDQKRRLLHRILHLEPKNREARRMLFEMDRAAIGGKTSRLSLAVILTGPSSSTLPEAPLVLRYSIVRQLIVYLLIACMFLAGLGLVGIFLIIPLWFVSAAIEISDSGLTVSRLFGMVRSQILWREIRQVRSTTIGKGIKVINRKGKMVEISAQVHGYPFLLDILRQRRPDVFPIR